MIESAQSDYVSDEIIAGPSVCVSQNNEFLTTQQWNVACQKLSERFSVFPIQIQEHAFLDFLAFMYDLWP